MNPKPIASADVVFVGGGICGHAGAAAAAGRGATVVLLEKGSDPAGEGSGRAQGSLRLQGRHAAEFPLATLPSCRPCARWSMRRTARVSPMCVCLGRRGAGGRPRRHGAVRRRDVERLRRPV